MRPIVLALLLAVLPAVAVADEEDRAEIPASVNTYADALKAKDMPLDTLFAIGVRAGNDLAGPQGVIGDLTDADYQTVVARMQGFLVNRNEVQYAQPNPAFFLERARAANDSVGIEFFEAYKQTVPEGILPNWFRPLTDYSGCVDFGKLALVQGYGRWKAFSMAHPHRYGAQVADFRRKIETILTVGNCACDEKDSVLKELNAFVEAYPKATIADRVRQRITAIAAGQGNIVYHCTP